MKRLCVLFCLLSLFVANDGFTQTSPTNEQQGKPAKKVQPKQPTLRSDSTKPANKKQPKRLNPDSLRRGGATRVDTVR